MALRPATMRKLLVVGWTVVVVATFMGIARAAPPVPQWVLWVVGIVVWLVGNIWLMVRETRQWRRLADALALQPETPIERGVQWLGMPDLVGTHRGREISLRTFSSGGHGNTHQTDWTFIGARLPGPTTLELDIRTGSWSRVGEPEAGAVPVPTHDDAFDQATNVYANDAGVAAQVLTGPVRQALGALDVPHRIVVDKDRVEQRVRTRLLDPERVRRHLDAAVALADEVERATSR